MPNFSTALTQEEAARIHGANRVDLGALEARLRDYADQWVPKEFPQGWRSDSGDEWVVGDISGKRASGNGSCRIKLRGYHAGDHYDFGIGRGGQVFSTIKERFKLGQGEVIREAHRILSECGVAVEHIDGDRPQREPRQSRAAERTGGGRAIWSHSGPIAGTLAERYLIRRGLQVSQSGALRFNERTPRTINGIMSVQPALIALFQLPDRTGVAIHRIYLTPDGRRDGEREMLGPTKGALVQLDWNPRYGLLGVGEGIETTLAASSLFNGVPGWAAGSAGGLVEFGKWLVAHPGWAWSIGIRRLLIWASRKAGEGAGRALLAACRTAGVDAQLWLPRGGDDFNDDLIKGLLPGVPVATTRDTEILMQREPGEIEP
jgi:putative DNA primase/helicase